MKPTKYLIMGSCLCAALSALPLQAMSPVECVSGHVTPASYTWDFKGEANTLFQDIQSDAQRATYHAEQLKSFRDNSEISWQTYDDQMSRMKAEINDMGGKLCRLETIRSAVAPWQQKTIDRIAKTVQLMADNAQDAIAFSNANQENLWVPTYGMYVNNLDDEANSLSQCTGDAVQYSKVLEQYRDLRNDLGLTAS